MGTALLAAGMLLAAPLSANSLTLTTESYPPFNFETEAGDLDGISVRVMDVLLEVAGVDAEIRLLPWSRAYAEAQSEPGTCVFSTTRTPEREDLFTWVGPLVENQWHAFVLEGAEVNASSLRDLERYRVGGYRDDAVALHVERQGIPVDTAPNDRLNARKLAANRIDVWVSGEHLAPWYARQEGVGALESLFAFNDTVMSLACHPETERAPLDRMQEELDAMRADGRYAAIVDAVLNSNGERND
ncbi:MULTISPECIES: ABC transporter substrate-binding protein [unclassified Thioalkalivibrio]|uniref:substrate-binding periplasmic protein n=1 Tax=unclassified Thioalkalivibrio TaxID=2621013 RepID=UPI0003A43173|nr:MULTISPECIES: transporter substrate-binding domain-containing protein [unclassified Thioalkalivibrio]